jgi:hypothetical protein
MRMSLLFGRFEYGKRGILDIERSEGIVVPMPFIFGRSVLSRVALAVNHALVRRRPTLFAFQILLVAKARPTLATLLETATGSAGQKIDRNRGTVAQIGIVDLNEFTNLLTNQAAQRGTVAVHAEDAYGRILVDAPHVEQQTAPMICNH